MQKNKVLFIITCDLFRGGITSVMLNHIRCSTEYVYDLAVAGETDPEVVDLFNKEDVSVYTFRKYPNVMKYKKELIKLIRNNKYSIVHVHGSSYTMGVELCAAKKAGCSVRIAHSHNTTCTSRLLNRLFKHSFESSYTNAVACGIEAGKWLFGDKPFIISKNGIQTNQYIYNEEIRQRLRNDLHLSQTDILIGNVSMFTEAKNHKFIMELLWAVSKYSMNYKLLLIGTGPLEKEIKHQILQLGIADKVVMLGTVSNVNEWLNAIDLIVMPSLYEGFPLALVEEQANGLRCLVSDVITKEINITGNVQFVKLDDIKAWEYAVLHSNLQYDRLKASKEAIVCLQDCGYDCMRSAQAIEKLYDNALGVVK